MYVYKPGLKPSKAEGRRAYLTASKAEGRRACLDVRVRPKAVEPSGGSAIFLWEGRCDWGDLLRTTSTFANHMNYELHEHSHKI